MSELNLPDPGGGKYWEITDAIDGDARLSLFDSDGKKLASDFVFKPVTVESILEVAHYLQRNASDFIGVYKFEGEDDEF